MRKAIINFADKNGNYILGQARLKSSLIKHGFDGDFIGWNSESQIGAPSHASNPYAFKTFAFKKAFEMGYDEVLLLDASVWAIKPLDYLFETIETKGWLMQEAGHYVGTWTNDNALRYFGITRDKAMHMITYGNAGMLGLSKHNEKSMEFLDRWHEASKLGAFIGRWDNRNNSESHDTRCKGHRHDLSCGSIIANQLKMDFVSGNEILAYASPTDVVNDNVYLKAQGL